MTHSRPSCSARLAIASLVALTALLPAAAHADDPPPDVVLPLVVHVAGGQPDAWTRALVDTAQEAFAPAHVRFDVTYVALPDSRRTLHTIADRRALRTLLGAHAIDAFLVDRADDPSPSASTLRTARRIGLEPSGRLGGAHVPAPGHTPATYLFVTRDGSRYSLAHELGHFLGCGHSGDREDIMSYAASRHRFAQDELATFRARALRALRSRALVAHRSR